ncbi:DUF2141 domain-containing protein [Pelomonas sp. SE-A7]|uniref:DUF2141 domain-containing protein n=1 Tax=Pelomonas sp. SE-A7 TaxID=3054953 RepID=UPI00259C9ED6|nr:DUF2141 domain-containing protein [Pelomonas sp. SE-A7]MDM4765488.1 DUF2141 domain-containing protein [Pelomonas sp. SE-A7]
MQRIIIAIAASLLATGAQAVELKIEGLKSNQGRLMVAAFDSGDSWLRKPVLAKTVDASAVKDGTLSIDWPELDGLPRAALTVFHDLNGNGKLDTNAMGMPTEPLGYSNNAVGNFGPARFDAAVFEPKPGQRQQIRLN